MNIKKIISFVILLLLNSALFAEEWVVNNPESQLNFVSVKKGTIGEIHQFNRIDGKLDAQGNFILNIDLTSVDTHIPIRDQRIKQYLFEVDKFNTAILTAKIDPELLKNIAEGNDMQMAVDAKLSLHGQSKPLTLNVIVTRLAGGQLSVTSAQPVLLNVNDFSLAAGVEKLRELAKLPSISHIVPVTFYLILKLKH